MSKQVKKEDTVHGLVWRAITRGVTDKLDKGQEFIDKWSPNNLRRLIISPEGVAFQPHIVKGTFYKRPLDVITFPQTEDTAKQIQSNKPITSVLYQDRVFSSIEEIVLILNSPSVPYTLTPRELTAVNSRINSFKRLTAIVIVRDAISLKDFILANQKFLASRYEYFHDSELGVLGYHEKVRFNKEWYKHTSLRPQYYSLDKEDGSLKKHFEDIRKNQEDKLQSSVLVAKGEETDEKSSKNGEDAKLVISDSTKEAMMYRLVQLNLVQDTEKANNRQSWFSEYADLEVSDKGKGFDLGDGVGDNGILKRIGLYSRGSKGTESELRSELLKQTLTTTVDLLKELEADYPKTGNKLKITLKDILTTKRNPKDLVKLQYRQPLDLSNLIDSEDITESELGQLYNSIRGIPIEDIQDIIMGILFDLGLPSTSAEIWDVGELEGVKTPDIPYLEKFILHDLVIYFNNLEHRTYNSLHKVVKTHVTDESINKRLKMLIKTLGLTKESEGKLAEGYAYEILTGVFKHKYRNKQDVIKQLIGSLNKDVGVEEVTGVFTEVVNLLVRDNSSKLTFIHGLTEMGSWELGVKGLGINYTTTNVLNKSRGIEENYSRYMEFLSELLLKG